MAVFHKERDSVFLGSDGIFFRNLEDLHILNRYLESALSPLIFSDLTVDDNGRFLGQSVDFLKKGIILFGIKGGALYDPGSIPDKKKTDLPSGTFVVKPTTDLDFLILVFFNVFNVYPAHNAKDYS
jgi:hypothetical protein